MWSPVIIKFSLLIGRAFSKKMHFHQKLSEYENEANSNKNDVVLMSLLTLNIVLVFLLLTLNEQTTTGLPLIWNMTLLVQKRFWKYILIASQRRQSRDVQKVNFDKYRKIPRKTSMIRSFLSKVPVFCPKNYLVEYQWKDFHGQCLRANKNRPMVLWRIAILKILRFAGPLRIPTEYCDNVWIAAIR